MTGKGSLSAIVPRGVAPVVVCGFAGNGSRGRGPSAITIYTNKETLNTLMTRFTAFLSSHCDEGNEDYDHNERRLAGLAARARRAAGAGAAPRH